MPRKLNFDRAAELAESFHNGNRSTVVNELRQYRTLDAAAMALVMVQSLAAGAQTEPEHALNDLLRAIVNGARERT